MTMTLLLRLFKRSPAMAFTKAAASIALATFLIFCYGLISFWNMALTTLTRLALYTAGESTMDSMAFKLLEVLSTKEIDYSYKIDLTDKLKAYIKHHSVPTSSIADAFACIRICLSNSELCDVGFSTLSHLSKRLVLQKQQNILALEGRNTFNLLLERLGDAKERIQQRAIQAFVDLWSASSDNVETFIRDKALTSNNPRAKKASMQWILQVHQQFSLQFRGFVAPIIACLEDSDSSVRDTAKSTLVQLFQDAPQHAKADLQKQLSQNEIWRDVIDSIGTKPETRKPAPAPARKAKTTTAPVELPTVSSPLAKSKVLELATRNATPSTKTAVTITTTTSTTHPTTLAPLFVSSKVDNDLKAIMVEKNLTFTYRLIQANRDATMRLDDCYNEMSPSFEGNESEKNWLHREAHIITLRKLTKGNAPLSFPNIYIVQVKGLLEAIIKAVNSLRTSLSTHGLLLIQEAAQTVGPALDTMVEIILQALVKQCGTTKTITAQHASTTINMIFSTVTFHHRLLQHIWNACQEKNVRPRGFAATWLKTLMSRYQHHSTTLEHSNGLDLMEKILQRGFADADPGVRENVRDTFWTFWMIWPARAEIVLHSLKPAAQKQLMQHPACPGLDAITTTSTNPTKALSTTRTLAPSKSRPSLKETMMANRKNKTALERPQSAMSTVSIMSTANMSSAPKRPIKATFKKAEAQSAKIATPSRPSTSGTDTAALPKPAQMAEVTTPMGPPTSQKTASTNIRSTVPSAPPTKTLTHSRSSSSSGESVRSTMSLPASKLPTRSRLSISSAGSSTGIVERTAEALPASKIARSNRSRSSTDSSASIIEEPEEPETPKLTDQSVHATFDSFACQRARKAVPTMADERVAFITNSIIISFNHHDTSRDDSKLLAQELLLLRDLSKARRAPFLDRLSDSVCAILGVLSRRPAPSTTTSALHDCLDELLLVPETQEQCMRAVTAMPPSEHTFRTLSKLVHQVRPDLFHDSLQASLMGLVEAGISNNDAAIRKAATEMGLALYAVIGDELTFWEAASRLSSEKKDLLRYYIDRRLRG